MATPSPLRSFQNDQYPPRRFGGGVGSSPGSRLSPAVQYRWRDNAERARSAGARVPFHIDRNSAVTDNRPMGAGPRILVVDDNDDNCYTLKLHLDLEGYTDVATARDGEEDRKSTRLNSSHTVISYAVFCLKKKKKVSA